MDIIKYIVTILIVLIVTVLLFSIFNIQIIIGKTYGLHNIVFPDLFDVIIKWLETHVATVTAIGIITTFILVYIGRIHKKRDELFESLKYDSAYLHAVFNEVDKTREILKGNNKIKDSNFEICNYVFAHEAYDKMSIDKINTEHPVTRSLILDFYDRIKIRNRMFIHRKESRHRFIRTTNNAGWTDFIQYVDPQIQQDESYLEGMSDTLIEILRSEIKNKDAWLEFEEKPFVIRYWLILNDLLERLKIKRLNR